MKMVLLDDGSWVSETFAHLAEILRDYDEYLELRWIPTDKRETKYEKENPYVIVDSRTNVVIKYVSERDDPKLVLAEIFGMDNIRNDPFRNMLDQNAAARLFELKQQLDKREEAKELSTFFLENKKSIIRHDGVKYDDQLRRLS